MSWIKFLNIRFPEGEKEKEMKGRGWLEDNKKGKSTNALNPLEISSAKGDRLATVVIRGATVVYPRLCLHLCGQKQQSVIRVPISNRQGPYCLLWLPQTMCKLILEHGDSCLSKGWRCAKKRILK